MQKVIPHDAILVPDMAKLAFQGKIFSVYQWPQKLFDGSEYTFEMLKRTDTVTAICIVDNQILILDDEQPHLGKRQSFPGGRVDPEDATTEAAVQREILEETGYRFKNWRLIKVSQPYRKMEWFVYVYLAWEVLEQTATQHDPGEKIEFAPHDFAAVKALVMNGVDYLGESRDLFGQIDAAEQLLTLPEFAGRSVDR